MQRLNTRDLDAFVQQSDILGGPGAQACEQYWQDLEYRPDLVVDETLDPFSEAYVDQQLAVYREMSGRDFDQLVNEHTALDVERHTAAVNPYDHGEPGGLALHIERLSRALRLGAPPRGGRLLDMGCGWGLSSEVAAYSGLNVTAVDVNTDFVSLVNRRANRLGLAIAAQHGTFEQPNVAGLYDMILFYECFHHALRPWAVLSRMAGLLSPNGKLVLAGEPINSYWWKHWGMRLDPLSVYCIRKFGWLESGWTIDFLHLAFRRAGLSCHAVAHPEGEIGYTIVGTQSDINRIPAQEIGQHWQHRGWLRDGEYLISQSESSLSIPFPADASTARLTLHNFRNKPLRVSIRANDTVEDLDLAPGKNSFDLKKMPVAVHTISLTCETWNPNVELNNGDDRTIGLHLGEVIFLM